MICLVTGGFGFVGTAFARRLVADNHAVTVVDNLSSGKVSQIGRHDVDFHEMDLRAFVNQWWVSVESYDLIIHCAAVVGGRLKIEGDPLAVATDLAIDSDFFNWISRSKNKKQKIIYFSSSAVYPTYLQTRKAHPRLVETLVSPDARTWGAPDQTYGLAKLAGECLAKQAVEKYDADVLIYRPFSGYGEDQALDYPFPSIIQRVANRDDPLTVWGSGEQCRDFIHIDDVVEAVMVSKDKMGRGEALNLGTGAATSFIDLAEMAAQEAGYDPKIITDTSKPEGVFHRVCDPHNMLKYYAPKISLTDGIRRALDTHKARV